jgi:hypothetical protein
MKSSIVLVLSFVLVQSVNAQNCDELFKQITDKVKRDRTSATVNGFDMACQIRVIMNDGQIYTEDMEITTQGKKYKYLSKKMNLYQDDKTSVVINTSDNTILITKPGSMMNANQYDQLTKIQDSVASYFAIQSCKKEWGLVDKNTGYYKMILLPKPKIKSKGVNSIAYGVAIDKMEVRKITIYYGPEAGDGIKEYEMVIKRMNDGKPQDPFLGSAINVIMEQGKLRSAYAGYSVIDKRNPVK